MHTSIFLPVHGNYAKAKFEPFSMFSLQKNELLSMFVSSINIYKFLNQDAFILQVKLLKILLLFSKKKYHNFVSFCLKQAKNLPMG